MLCGLRYPLRIDRLGLQLSDTAAGFRVVGQDAFMQWATALIDRSKMLCELFGASASCRRCHARVPRRPSAHGVAASQVTSGDLRT